MNGDNKKDEPKVQAEDNSIAVGGITVGGDVSGGITIGHGYTAEQVSVLLTQITTTFQPKPFDGRCPYKGLDVFEEEDAELFFGRERLVEDLISRVKESRTVFITGPSGSGKSSLVRAGLIHALKQGKINALRSERWLYETMKPGREPIKDLALAFSRLKSPELSNYFLTHKNEINILNECAESVLSGHKDQRFVLFVDQFEEVFTQINQEEERVVFINMLAHAGTMENGRVIVLFAMRSDFVSNCATYPALNEMLSQEFRQIGAMQPEELVSAIALPARHVGLPIEDELIARIINDMKGEPGALPLMQFALKDLFDSQQEKGGVIALTLADYLKQGGIHKSLERHADHSFAQLSEGEQGLARSIFSGLIEIGRGTQDTRRTALFDELVPANAKAEDVQAVIQKLADARLIITDEQAGKDTVTISHEKLIDAWPWLKKLVNENRDVIALQNEIASDAKEWEDHQRDPSYLYTGARLANAREQLEAKKLVLSGLAQSFIEASVKAHADELEATKQRALQLRRRSVYLTAALVGALIAVGVAVFFSVQSRQRANIALARQLAAQAQSVYATENLKQVTAVLLAIQSMHMFPSFEAGQILQNNTMARPLSQMIEDSAVIFVGFSPDGKYVVSGSEDNTIRVWEVATSNEIARGTYEFYVSTVAFSSDSKYVVSGGDTTARVWEATTGKEIARMSHDASVSSVAFSSDGKYVVSGSNDKTARVWEAATGKEIARMTHDSYVNAVALSPDGKYVVSGSDDKTARVWEMTTGKEIARMTHDGDVTAVAFSPDSKSVVSESPLETVRVWEASTGTEIARKALDVNFGYLISYATFSPDGKYVVSRSDDNTIRVWEATTGKEIARMTHEDYVSSVAFSPDGKYVVSGSNDKTARVWEAATGKEIARMTHDGEVTAVAFSPDGKYVVSGSWDNTVRVWEPTRREITRLTYDGSVTAVSFSHNGKYVVSEIWHKTAAVSGPDGQYSESWSTTVRIREIATGNEITHITDGVVESAFALSSDGQYMLSRSNNNTVKVWETATGKEIAHMTHDDIVAAVAFSLDGKYVVSGGDKSIRVWEATTGKEIAHITDGVVESAVSFSPDGKYVMTGGCFYQLGISGPSLTCAKGAARVWEAVTGREMAFLDHDSWVTSVAFSPDSKYVALGNTDRTVWVWEVTTGREIAHMSHDDWVTSVAFSPDGKYILSGSGDNTVRVWEATTGQEVARMSHDDWVSSVAFSPDGKYILSGSNDHTARLWIWRPDDLIADACSRVTRNLTRVEWKQYIGDLLRYQAVCRNLSLEPEVTPTP